MKTGQSPGTTGLVLVAALLYGVVEWMALLRSRRADREKAWYGSLKP